MARAITDPRPTRRLFLIERFWPGVTAALATEATTRLREAAARLAPPDRGVRHVSSTLLPDDEVLFTFVEADAVTSVQTVSDLAAFSADRITESLTVWPPSGRDA